jgi:hypothetical protein
MKNLVIFRWILLCFFILFNFYSIGYTDTLHRETKGTLVVNGQIGPQHSIIAHDIKVNIEDVPELDIINASGAKVIRLDEFETPISRLVLISTDLKAKKGKYIAQLGIEKDPSVKKTISIIVDERENSTVSQQTPRENKTLLPKLGLNTETYVFMFGLLILLLIFSLFLRELYKYLKNKEPLENF